MRFLDSLVSKLATIIRHILFADIVLLLDLLAPGLGKVVFPLLL